MPFDPMIAGPDVFLAELLAARRELDTALAGLTVDELEQPGMTGVWSGRMTLVHIARWDEATTQIIVRDRYGILPGVNEYDDYEAWNDRWAEIDADIPLDTARARYETAHEAIVRTLHGFQTDEWTPLVRGWVRVASLEHYLHHAETTRRWRTSRQT